MYAPQRHIISPKQRMVSIFLDILQAQYNLNLIADNELKYYNKSVYRFYHYINKIKLESDSLDAIIENSIEPVYLYDILYLYIYFLNRNYSYEGTMAKIMELSSALYLKRFSDLFSFFVWLDSEGKYMIAD